MNSCSQIFYAKEILKVPEPPTNPKTLIGSLCHIIFECLARPRHKKHYDKIMTFPESIFNSKPITRLVQNFIQKHQIPEEIHADLDNLVLVGLNNDFFFKGAEKVFPPEYAFILDTGKYRIKGIIDGAAIYKDNIALIRDYKSQRDKFTDEKLKNNIQAKAYQLAMYKQFGVLARVEFVLLRHAPTKNNPNNHLQIVEPSTPEELEGFEVFLEHFSDYVIDFNEDKAESSLAFDKGYSEEGFAGRIMCGRSSYPNQLKKDGTPMFSCSFKWPRDYYVQIDKKTGKIISSNFTKKELTPQRGTKIEKRHYEGCPRFRKQEIPY